ncbi:hypothetical protein [Undibacterium sp. TJN19]|uniref:hypothetical protein n=1 Tax=Undibacterium sp. TJN19 TaxID=3413055 RepID=UPI003BF0EDAD
MQELNMVEVEEVSGAGFGRDWLLGKLVDAVVESAVEWAQSGAGIGGRMDTMGKLG